LRADDTPAAGATVLLVRGDARDWQSEAGRATTGADGIASLRAPEEAVRVIAWLGDQVDATGRSVVAKAEPQFTMHLEPGVPITGRVVTAGGVPVPGAEVRVNTA